LVAPVIKPGVNGTEYNANVLEILEEQELFDLTLKGPETKLPETANTTDVVPCPETIVVPIGAVQV
jgi:hypothetical protein